MSGRIQDKHTNDIFLMLFIMRDEKETESMATCKGHSTPVTRVTASGQPIDPG